MKRRQAILAVVAAAFAPSCAFAQQKLRRAGMKEHGWVEGRNLVLELRWAQGDMGRLPALAAELVAVGLHLLGEGSRHRRNHFGTT